MAFGDQEGGGRRSIQILTALILSAFASCKGEPELEPAGESLLFTSKAPPASVVMVLAGSPDGPGYPRSNGRPFLSVSWPPAPGKTEVLAKAKATTLGDVALAIPWPRDRQSPRTIQAVVFAGENEDAPAISVSPAFTVNWVDDNLSVTRDGWLGVLAAAPAIGIALLLCAACFIVRRRNWVVAIPIVPRAILAALLASICAWPRLHADPGEARGRRGDIHPIIPVKPDDSATSNENDVSTLVDTIAQHVPRSGFVRIAPCSSSGPAFRLAAEAAWRLWPRQIVWISDSQSLDITTEAGCSLIFRPPPSELPVGMLLLCSTQSAFVLETLPR